MSLAELVRRGLELLLARFPAGPTMATPWELPKPRPLGGDAFFANSDIVSLHVRLKPETRGIITAADLAADGNRISASSAFVAHGSAAQLFLVSGASGSWLVRADAPGVTVTAQTTMDQTRPYARVTITGAEGEPLADGDAGANAATNAALIVLAAEGLGLAQAALDRTVAYSRDRVQFGRAIGSFQAYKHRLADMMVEIEQARSAVYWAACAVDEGADDAQLAVHAAKSFAADTAFRCASDMIQLHGGIGFTWDHDAHLFFKRARGLQTMMGNGDWHREQIAAMVLGETA
jgi:alkylation response protein AidB-like acyl-CoA dehydrogenase